MVDCVVWVHVARVRFSLSLLKTFAVIKTIAKKKQCLNILLWLKW